MILSTFSEIENAKLPEKITQIIKEVQSLLEKHPENGEYPLSHDAKAIISISTTHPLENAPYESHVRMTDVHILLEGEEYLYIRPSSELTAMNDPDEIKAVRADLPTNASDMQFYKEQGNEHARLHLKKGNFCVIFPGEAHAVDVMVEKSSKIKKLIVKVPL